MNNLIQNQITRAVKAQAWRPQLSVGFYKSQNKISSNGYNIDKWFNVPTKNGNQWIVMNEDRFNLDIDNYMDGINLYGGDFKGRSVSVDFEKYANENTPL